MFTEPLNDEINGEGVPVAKCGYVANQTSKAPLLAASADEPDSHQRMVKLTE
jgi:hypothetical protein